MLTETTDDGRETIHAVLRRRSIPVGFVVPGRAGRITHEILCAARRCAPNLTVDP